MAPLTILMSNTPPTVSPKNSVNRALDLMRTADVAELLVMDSGRLVGAVSQQDIWQYCPTSALLLDDRQADYLLTQFRVGGVMTLHPQSSRRRPRCPRRPNCSPKVAGLGFRWLNRARWLASCVKPASCRP